MEVNSRVEDFRNFIQRILTVFLPKIKKMKMKRIKIQSGGLAVKPDEYLIGSRPFRFTREGAKRPIEKRQR